MVGLIIIENTIKEKRKFSFSTEMRVNENDWWIETGVNGGIWL